MVLPPRGGWSIGPRLELGSIRDHLNDTRGKLNMRVKYMGPVKQLCLQIPQVGPLDRKTTNPKVSGPLLPIDPMDHPPAS